MSKKSVIVLIYHHHKHLDLDCTVCKYKFTSHDIVKPAYNKYPNYVNFFSAVDRFSFNTDTCSFLYPSVHIQMYVCICDLVFSKRGRCSEKYMFLFNSGSILDRFYCILHTLFLYVCTVE
jgi:hypothetical protein